MKEKTLDYGELIGKPRKPKVYVIQEIPGTSEGTPKINILGAREYGDFVFVLPERSQIIFSPGPLIFKLRTSFKKLYSQRLFIINRRSCNYWSCMFYCI